MAHGATEFYPLGQRITLKMQSEEVLEVVEGEQEIGDTGSLGGVVSGAVLIVPVVEVEVGPNVDGATTIRSSSLVVGAFDFPEGADIGDRVLGANKA